MNLDRNYRWFTVTLLSPDRTKKQYIFRGVTKGEMMAAGSKSGGVAAEDFILERCVLNIEDLSIEWAGTCQCLLEQIYNISGLDSEERTVQEAVAWIQDPEEGKYEAVAVALIPGCTPAILRTCDPSDRAKYLLVATFMYRSLYGREVEELFNGPSSNDIESGYVGADPIPIPKQGETVTYSDGGFNWSSKK